MNHSLFSFDQPSSRDGDFPTFCLERMTNGDRRLLSGLLRRGMGGDLGGGFLS
jgi:hypothetical protein